MRSSFLTALPLQRMAAQVMVKRVAHVSLFGYWSIWRHRSTYAGAFSQCTRTWSLRWDVKQCCFVGIWWMMISAGANYAVLFLAGIASSTRCATPCAQARMVQVSWRWHLSWYCWFQFLIAKLTRHAEHLEWCTKSLCFLDTDHKCVFSKLNYGHVELAHLPFRISCSFKGDTWRVGSFWHC